MQKAALAAAVLAAPAFVAGIAFAKREEAHPHTLATQFVHTSALSRYRPVVRTRVVRGKAAERAAAALVVRGFGPANRVLRIEFTPPPEEFGLPATQLWVTIDVAAPDRPGAAFSIWQAFLVVSAVADANRASEAEPVAGKSIRLVFPNGSTADAGSAVDGPLPAPSDAPAASAEALAAAIREAARQQGLRVAEQGSFDVGGYPAVYATLVTDHPSAFPFSEPSALLDTPAAAAGSFIEVRDAAGGVVDSGGSATRLQQGVGWTNPAFGSRAGLVAP